MAKKMSSKSRSERAALVALINAQVALSRYLGGEYRALMATDPEKAIAMGKAHEAEVKALGQALASARRTGGRDSRDGS